MEARCADEFRAVVVLAPLSSSEVRVLGPLLCAEEILELINDPDPGPAEIGLALGSHLRSGIVLAMIDHPDARRVALGEELAVYLPADTLTAMAISGDPRHARIPGEAVARRLGRVNPRRGIELGRASAVVFHNRND